MDPEILDALELYALNLASGPRFKLEDFLFKEQLSLALDESKFATAVCSVRAGKTVTCAADLIYTALAHAGTVGLYITLSRKNAKRIVWPDINNINRVYGLGGVTNEQDLSIRFPNGSIIYCSGANNTAEIENFRGLSNVILVYIDESQSFRSFIKGLVDDIIIKRLYDTDGRLRLIGTPGPIPSGYFYDACHSSEWSHHAWTLHSNPWIERKSGKTVAQLIEDDCRKKGVGIDDPSIQRECFGRWVLDKNSLILNYNPEKNHFDELPRGDYQYILGVDLGLKDADSLSLLAFSKTSPTTYLVKEILTTNQLTDSLAAQIQALRREYPTITAMPADAGGLGAKIIEDLKARYAIPLIAAEKKDKMANYRLLNNALQNGSFKAKKDSRFAQDCNLLEIDRDKSTPEKMIVKGHSDAVDSTLYAFKLSPAYGYSPPPEKPKPGTPEFYKAQEEDHVKAAVEQIKRQVSGTREVAFGTWNKDKKGIADWNKW